MVTSASTLQPIPEGGWTSGLGNLLRKELHDWWGTRFWLVQCLVWLAVINGILAMPLWVVPLLDPKSADLSADGGPYLLGLQMFFSIAAQFGAVGVAILAQGAIIGEKQSGTAAWVLSKPVSREAFVPAKLAGLGIGVLAVVVALQGAIAYLQISLVAGRAPELGQYTAGLGMLALHALFYLCLSLLLGSLLNSRGAAIGIALGVLFGQQILGSFLGPVAAYLPGSLSGLATAVAMGEMPPTYAPIFGTALLSLACIATAVWRFEREEL